MRTIGVISDTHGLLRPEALEALGGCDAIIHAGDVGGAEILSALERIAPVRAVRGNTDYGPFGASLPRTEAVDLGVAGRMAWVLHDVEDLDLDPASAGFAVVVYGHSHRPAIEERGGVLYFNPGAAGPRRFDLPVTVGLLELSAAGDLTPRIVHLDVHR
jgi:putative phosphoesterase